MIQRQPESIGSLPVSAGTCSTRSLRRLWRQRGWRSQAWPGTCAHCQTCCRGRRTQRAQAVQLAHAHRAHRTEPAAQSPLRTQQSRAHSMQGCAQQRCTPCAHVQERPPLVLGHPRNRAHIAAAKALEEARDVGTVALHAHSVPTSTHSQTPCCEHGLGRRPGAIVSQHGRVGVPARLVSGLAAPRVVVWSAVGA